MEAKPTDILLNKFTKKPYLLIKKEQVLMNKITLYDITSREELRFEIESPNGIILSRDMKIIEPRLYLNRSTDISEFNRIEKDFAEEYLITTTQLDTINGLIQQLNHLSQDIFTERKSTEKGTKTTENTATELIHETGHSKRIIEN